MCGEKDFRHGIVVFVAGSPPHVRGKATKNGFSRPGVGITPACAGKSVCRGTGAKPLWDHPRVCGEKFQTGGTVSDGAGSPPRMRGKGVHIAHRQGCEGITPAYAGKRWAQGCPAWVCRDHPRVCGEKTVPAFHLYRCLGSPPRMRGKGASVSAGELYVGITPACAGKRVFRCHRMYSCTDHPRVCGEKRSDLLVWSFRSGSPPRVRGKGFAPVCLTR